MALIIEIAIPITMQDLNSGVQRPATADEVRVGLKCIGNSLTHWPDEIAPAAWWEEPGTVVFAKLRGFGVFWPNFYFMEAGKDYEMWIDYVFDPTYQTYRVMRVNEDGSTSWVV